MKKQIEVKFFAMMDDYVIWTGEIEIAKVAFKSWFSYWRFLRAIRNQNRKLNAKIWVQV